MLYLNVSDDVLNNWGRTIDLYYAIHLSGFLEDIKSVNLLIEEIDAEGGYFLTSEEHIYRCELSVIPESGEKIWIVVTREDCAAAIEHSFAKAKRTLLRRARGIHKASQASHMIGSQHDCVEPKQQVI